MSNGMPGESGTVLDSLTKNGYAVIPAVLSPGEVESYRTAIIDLHGTDPGVAAKRASNQDLLHIENLPNKGLMFESYFLLPRILDIVYQMIGNDCVLRDAWSLSVPPSDGESSRLKRVFSSLHCEDALAISEAILSVTTTYTLVDFTEQNGATRVVPGSHLRGMLPDQTMRDQEIAVEAPAGSCIMMLGSLWHAAGENASGELRVAMGAYYARAWIRPFFDFTRALDADVLRRATPQARRLFGFHVQPPYVERWMWDGAQGSPRSEFGPLLRQRGLGDCCLPGH